MREAFTVEFTPADGPRRRVRFYPREYDGWWREMQLYTGCSWRTIGREVVSNVVCESDSEVLVG